MSFTSALTKEENIFAALGLVLLVFLFPHLASNAAQAELISYELASFLVYACTTVYVIVFFFRFLRQDFDPLADRPLAVIVEVLFGFFLLQFFNDILAGIFALLHSTENPNNQAIMEMAVQQRGMTTAMSVFLAPIAEEVLFRGCLFGSLRKYNRLAAYIVSVLAFSFYHLHSYILSDIKNAIYLIQYIPASVLLCRCYENTNTVWCPIALHMLVNSIAIQMAAF